MMRALSRGTVCKARDQVGILMGERSPPGKHVFPDGSVVLKIGRYVGVAVFQACNSAGRGLHVNAVGPDFEIVVPCGLLPGNSPVGRHATNIDGECFPGRGLRRSKMS